MAVAALRSSRCLRGGPPTARIASATRQNARSRVATGKSWVSGAASVRTSTQTRPPGGRNPRSQAARRLWSQADAADERPVRAPLVVEEVLPRDDADGRVSCADARVGKTDVGGGAAAEDDPIAVEREPRGLPATAGAAHEDGERHEGTVSLGQEGRSGIRWREGA